jgi:hypothetical protein
MMDLDALLTSELSRLGNDVENVVDRSVSAIAPAIRERAYQMHELETPLQPRLKLSNNSAGYQCQQTRVGSVMQLFLGPVLNLGVREATRTISTFR